MYVYDEANNLAKGIQKDKRRDRCSSRDESKNRRL